MLLYYSENGRLVIFTRKDDLKPDVWKGTFCKLDVLKTGCFVNRTFCKRTFEPGRYETRRSENRLNETGRNVGVPCITDRICSSDRICTTVKQNLYHG
jgi:hypothetical protein